jgi:hypothetical protein
MNQIIRKFNPMILENKRIHGHAPIIVILAKQGYGKSTLIKDIVSHLHIPTSNVISTTETGFDMIKKIFEEQTKKAAIFVHKHPDKIFSDCPEQGILIIMDDFPFDEKMMKDPIIKQLFFNGRHFNITIVLSFQYLIAIPPEFRMNIDYLFVGRDTNKDYVFKLYKIFFEIFENVDDFEKLFNLATNNYGYLVFDKTTKSDILSDNIFWYRVQIKPHIPKNWILDES